MHGTTRDLGQMNTRNLVALQIADQVTIRGLDLTERQSTLDLIDELRPDEIYHLAAPSSVARSFKEPASTIESITQTTVNLLDSVRIIDDSIRCFVASSTEIFGQCDAPVTVHSAHNPASPYGVGKSCAHYQARNYREAYGLYVCSGVLSNFESVLRTPNYVTSKIIIGACKIALGETNSISLGNLSVRRDWGNAADFMQAANLCLLQDQPRDYLIATGKTHSLLQFLESVCALLGLDYRNHLEVEESLFRPRDIPQTLCDPSATNEQLNWQPQTSFNQLAFTMLKSELIKQAGEKRAHELLDTNHTNIIALDQT